MAHDFDKTDVPKGCSLDDFLGGAVKLIQPTDGYRISMDTVMLAASVPARAGEHVLEAGTGTAGAALCLAERVKGVKVTGLELQKSMIEIAEHNIVINQTQGLVRVVEGDITAPPTDMREGQFDHVIANPPYLSMGKAIRPPALSKGLAHMNSSATLKDWVHFCILMARHKGTVTFIHRADRLDEIIHLMHRRVGEICLFPLWPRAGSPAKRVIVQGRKGMHGVMRVLPGIALHGEVDRYTKEAEAVLRHGQALDLGTITSLAHAQK